MCRYQFHYGENVKPEYRVSENMWVEYDEFEQTRYRFSRDHILTRYDTPVSMWTDEFDEYYDSDFPMGEIVSPPEYDD